MPQNQKSQVKRGNSIQQEEITLLHLYTPNNTEFMKQKLTEIKGKIDKSLITVGDLNTPISTMIF